MIERLLIVVLLFALGIAVYHLLKERQVRRLQASAPADPLLAAARPGVPAIVYFTTPMCMPCRTHQGPALEQLQREVDAVQIIKIDATEDPAAADRWGVLSTPTTFILDATLRVREVNHGVADAQQLKRQLARVEAA